MPRSKRFSAVILNLELDSMPLRTGRGRQLAKRVGRTLRPVGVSVRSKRTRINPSGRAKNSKLIQALTAVAVIAFCFNNTNAGILREFSAHTLFAATIRFSNSAAE